MSFLDWVADWAERIPLVGSHISSLVKKIQGAIESWTWLWRYYAETLWDWYWKVKYTIEDFVDDPAGFITQRLPNWIREKINDLKNSLDVVRNWYYYVKEEVDKFVNDPFGYINDHIPEWIKKGVNDALNGINWLANELKNKWDAFTNWVNNSVNWWWNQLQNARDTIIAWIKPVIDPVIGWVNWFKNSFAEFLKDPVGYITKAVNPVINQITDTLNGFVDWVKQQLGNVQSAIIGLDMFIGEKLLQFLNSFVAWFLWTFFNDLITIEYDTETGEIYGQPTNPVTMILIGYFEMKEPEYPYESVKEEVTS